MNHLTFWDHKRSFSTNAVVRSALLMTVSAVLLLSLTACGESSGVETERHTKVTIEGEQFHINGVPTYQGRTWTTDYGGEYPVEGLLMNARLVQGVFDDRNERTRGQWAYPDTGEWDPDRNTDEFIKAMASWREHGLLGFTLNLQGGCPYGYCSAFPWENSAFAPDGSLRSDFMDRAGRIIDHADELGMVVLLGYFYFGEDGVLEDEAAVNRAVDNATEWVLDNGYTNVIIEINNECNAAAYEHDILGCDRVHELIERVRQTEIDGRTLYTSTSLMGGAVPPPNIVEASDYILLHGNGVRDPQRMAGMIEEVKAMDEYSPMPVVNNEDDQPWRVEEQGWEERGNNFTACVKNYAGWGYFDFRLPDEHHDYNLGYQSVPVNWQISSQRKRDFFDLLARITGSPGTPKVELEFSEEPGSSVAVSLMDMPEGMAVNWLEVIVNNEVAGSAEQAPYEFNLDLAVPHILDGEHRIKARLTYERDGRRIVVESPYLQNPWWPYGGDGS